MNVTTAGSSTHERKIYNIASHGDNIVIIELYAPNKPVNPQVPIPDNNESLLITFNKQTPICKLFKKAYSLASNNYCFSNSCSNWSLFIKCN